jgi:hypothetical protein
MASVKKSPSVAELNAAVREVGGVPLEMIEEIEKFIPTARMREPELNSAVDKLTDMIKFETVGLYRDANAIKRRLTERELRMLSKQLTTEKGRADYMNMLAQRYIKYLEGLLESGELSWDDPNINVYVQRPFLVAATGAKAATDAGQSLDWLEGKLKEAYNKHYAPREGKGEEMRKRRKTKKTQRRRRKEKGKRKTNRALRRRTRKKL